MALGQVVNSNTVHKQTPGVVVPQGLTQRWQTIVDAGGVNVQDASTVTNPTTQVVNSTSHIFRRNGIGTHLVLRLKYDDGLSSITDVVVKVFGRSSDSEPWQLLKSRSGNLSVALTTVLATDAEDGTYKYTTPDYDLHAWDSLSCNEFIVGIETALAGTGTVSTATIEAKML